MKRISVLGAGMVGSAIAVDLAKNHNVNVYDLNESNLGKMSGVKNITTFKVDLSNPVNLADTIDCDVVVSAVPGFMGFKTLAEIIRLGKNVVDISFFGEDPFMLDELAKEKNVTAVVDCGVAPGLSNLVLGHFASKLELDSFECYIGGLPFKRVVPYEYKAPFSPVDVIEEYTRPARFVENGKVVTKPALSDPEILNFEKVGSLEAFNTDGLRSLIRTLNIPYMKEKTLRYPGHIDKIRFLRDSGLFSEEKLNINGTDVSPLEMTSKILFDHWRSGEEEREFTVMRIILSVKGNKIIVEMFDEYDQLTKTSSMARTTGYTCTAVVNLLLNGSFSNKGIIPPEYIGREPELFRSVLEYLKARNITLLFREE